MLGDLAWTGVKPPVTLFQSILLEKMNIVRNLGQIANLLTMIQAAYLSESKTMDIQRHILWQAKLDNLENRGHFISIVSKITVLKELLYYSHQQIYTILYPDSMRSAYVHILCYSLEHNFPRFCLCTNFNSKQCMPLLHNGRLQYTFIVFMLCILLCM